MNSLSKISPLFLIFIVFSSCQSKEDPMQVITLPGNSSEEQVWCDIDYADEGDSAGVIDEEDSNKLRNIILFKGDISELDGKFYDWSGDGKLSTFDINLYNRFSQGKLSDNAKIGECDCFKPIQYDVGHPCNKGEWSQWKDILIYGEGDSIVANHESDFVRTTPDNVCQYRVRVIVNGLVYYYPDTRRIFINTAKDGLMYSKYYVEFDIDNPKALKRELDYTELVDINDPKFTINQNCKDMTRGERFYFAFNYLGHDEEGGIQREHVFALLTNPEGAPGRDRYNNFCYLYNNPQNPLVAFPAEQSSIAEQVSVHPREDAEVRLQQRCLE